MSLHRWGDRIRDGVLPTGETQRQVSYVTYMYMLISRKLLSYSVDLNLDWHTVVFIITSMEFVDFISVFQSLLIFILNLMLVHVFTP